MLKQGKYFMDMVDFKGVNFVRRNALSNPDPFGLAWVPSKERFDWEESSLREEALFCLVY